MTGKRTRPAVWGLLRQLGASTLPKASEWAYLAVTMMRSRACSATSRCSGVSWKVKVPQPGKLGLLPCLEVVSYAVLAQGSEGLEGTSRLR